MSGGHPPPAVPPVTAVLKLSPAKFWIGLGIGANGVGVGVAYFLYQIAFHERTIDTSLAWEAAGVGLFAGIVLELVNFLFLSKRQRIRRLSADLDEAREEGRRLQKLLREANRV